MAFDYTNLYPDTSGNGGYTKSWNYTTVVDNVATCSASGYFNAVASRLGIGDNIVIAQVDAFDTKNRTTLLDKAVLFVTSISVGVVTTVNAASLVSPAFTGIPTAPTAAPGTNSNQIATTAYSDAADALKLISPAFTGTPTAPTAAPATNSTQLATTAYADAINAGVTTALALKAPLASPALTGTPTAPTAAPGTNTTQLATTAYADAIATLKANLASPALTGTPLAPTASPNTNTTQIATTAYADAIAALKANLVSPTFTTPNLGTPSAATLTSATGLPVASGISGLATGAATFLATATSANLAALLTDETGTGASVFGTSPTVTTPNIVGTTAVGNAAAGSVAEYVSSIIASGSAVALTTGAPANLTSISLTAGDWNVWAIFNYLPGATTNISQLIGSISLTTGASSLLGDRCGFTSYGSGGVVPNVNCGSPMVKTRINVSSTTTIFAVVQCTFTVSTLGAWGSLQARRVR